MSLTSQEFNTKIGRQQILREVLKTDLPCPRCRTKFEQEIDKIQDYLESGAEMGVILP